MARRTKILVVCGSFDKALDECLEWAQVLKDELKKGVKFSAEEKRVETPLCIMDFVNSKPMFCKEYKYILPENCNSEDVLSIAIGEIENNKDNETSIS